jgi:NAD(P)-dependent dehydrogenase (short-subunit alcohol dehydrogenase family)
MVIENKKSGALVTGGARRIGRAIALGLAKDGWHVIVHYHQSEKAAEQTVAEIVDQGGRATAIAADLSNADSAIQLIIESISVTGELSCLVNNASLFVNDSILSFNSEDFNSMMAVNLSAPILLSRAFSEKLPESGGGVIINLLDQKLVNPNPDFLSYTLSKYGLNGLTTMLAMSLGPRVRVCGVAPGLVLPSADQTRDQFSKVHDLTPLERGATVFDIASAVCYLVSAAAVTGEVLLVDGGQHLVGSMRDVMFENTKSLSDEVQFINDDKNGK